MRTNRPEFKAHDDFIIGLKKTTNVTRDEFTKYIRNSHEQMRELSQIIKQYDQTIRDYLEEWDSKIELFELFETAESERVSNEEERISKDNERNSKIDSKANKIQEDWITPTLLNGFTGDVRYRKTQFGHLEIYGTIVSVNPINVTPLNVFSLPSGYRPARDVKFDATSNSYYSFTNARMVYSTYDKVITIYAGQGGSSWEINVSIPID